MYKVISFPISDVAQYPQENFYEIDDTLYENPRRGTKVFLAHTNTGHPFVIKQSPSSEHEVFISQQLPDSIATHCHSFENGCHTLPYRKNGSLLLFNLPKIYRNLEKSKDGGFGVQLFLVEKILTILIDCHKYGVAHRDFTASNLLLDFQFGNNQPLLNLTIADFEQSTYFGDVYSYNTKMPLDDTSCTPGYGAPELYNLGLLRNELLENSAFDVLKRVDSFALGAVLYFVLTGEFLMPTQHGMLRPNIKSILDNAKIRISDQRGVSRHHENSKRELLKLVLRLMEISPRDRINPETILEQVLELRKNYDNDINCSHSLYSCHQNLSATTDTRNSSRSKRQRGTKRPHEGDNTDRAKRRCISSQSPNTFSDANLLLSFSRARK